VLVLDMIEILHPFRKYKYDTWRILPVKCYVDNFVRLRSYKRNVNSLMLTAACDSGNALHNDVVSLLDDATIVVGRGCGQRCLRLLLLSSAPSSVSWMMTSGNASLLMCGAA
jgi:hypothetical protein